MAEPDPNAALAREFHRVGEEVLDDLADLAGIRHQSPGGVFLNFEHEWQPFFLELGPDQLEQVFQELWQVDGFRVDRGFAGLYAGQIEDVLDQVFQVLAGAVDHVGLVTFIRFEVRLAGEHLRQQQDGIQRRTQLMADVGEEFGLVAVRLFEFPGVGAQVA